MEKKMFYFPVLLLFLLNVMNQAQDWVIKDYTWLNSVFFVNNTTGWVVGDHGKILKTTDGGTTWQTQNSGTAQQLESVFFLNATTGYICGEAGQIRKTTDGGNTWADRYLGYSQICHSIHFVSENVGWVGTYYGIYKTTDGGLNWVNQYWQTRVRSLYFTDENHGWAAFEVGVFKRTTDGGTTWLNATTLNAGTFMSVYFIDNNNGWIAGHADCLRKTTDGGINWINIDNGFSGYGYFMVKFINTMTGWLVGTSGLVLKTTDGGITWNQQSTNVPYDLRALAIVGTDGWICGVGGIILKNSASNPLPVQLSEFTLTNIGDRIILKWKTETEINNFGFEVERERVQEKIENGEWQKIGFINGNGNSNTPKSYSFTDYNVKAGQYFYRLKQIDNDGQYEYTDIIGVHIIPASFKLEQNYPNPFNPVTIISYELPIECSVKIKIFDSLGREIAKIVDEEKEAGRYEVEFDASKFASEVFYCSMEAENYNETKKMILLK